MTLTISDIKIGITGAPSAGKTYALNRVLDELRKFDDELKIGGMINEPIMVENRKVGFTVENILTGEKECFAHKELESNKIIDSMPVDFDVLERVGVEAIKTAWDDCDIIVIDEVGKIEVECPAFVNIVKDVIESEKPLLVTLHKKSRNPLLQDIRRKDDIRILEVTKTNRNLLPFKIVRLLNGELQ